MITYLRDKGAVRSSVGGGPDRKCDWGVNKVWAGGAPVIHNEQLEERDHRRPKVVEVGEDV